VPVCRLCGSVFTEDQGVIPDSDYFAGQVLANPLAGGRLWGCTDCRSMFRHPVLPLQQYLSLYQSGAPDQWSGGEHREDLRIIRSIVAEARSGSALDVGCGTGDFLASLPATVAKFAVEPSAAALVASNRGIEIVAKELDHCSADGRFDVVTIIDLIEHIPEPDSFLQRAYTHVSPGGMLIVSTGDPETFFWRRLLRSRFWYVSFPEHVSFPALGFFQRWCARTGAVLAERHEMRYQRMGLAHLVLGLTIQSAFFASPRAFSWAGRLMDALRAQDRPRRRAFAPGIPGTYVDHQIVVMRKPAV
jgi:SAM-dependent methyltransferase